MESYIEMLPAMHGDAFFLHCWKGEQYGVIVVDGGPSSNALKNPFVNEVEKLPKIDLMVLSHQDNDHLIGFKTFVKRHLHDETFPIKKMWVNCARKIDFDGTPNLSAPAASSMADCLKAISTKSPLHWCEYIHDGCHDEDITFADIDVIGPNKDTLSLFIEKYEAKVTPHEINLADEEPKECDYDIPMQELAKRAKKAPNPNDYNQLANMASVSLIVEADGLKVLMLGDSFPDEVVLALEHRGFSEDKPLRVDFVKVAHHGSPNNINNKLLDMIDCANFIIPTNGGTGRSKHPQRETLANILCHPHRNYDRTVHFFFNYPMDLISPKDNNLFNPELDKGLNFEIHAPESKCTCTKYKLANPEIA